MLAPTGQQVGRDGQRLESHEDREEVTGRGHDRHAEQRCQEQHVVLALVVVALLDVVGRYQDRDVARHEEQRLHQEGVVVDDVRPAEHRPVGAVAGQIQDRDHRGETAEAGDRGRLVLLPLLEEEIRDEDHDDGRREDDLRRQRGVVEIRGRHR